MNKKMTGSQESPEKGPWGDQTSGKARKLWRKPALSKTVKKGKDWPLIANGGRTQE